MTACGIWRASPVPPVAPSPVGPETPRMAPRPAATAKAAGLLPHSSGPVIVDGPDGCEPEWPPSPRGVARQPALILCQPSQPLGLLDRVESSPLSE
jgi:hypothetical protein